MTPGAQTDHELSVMRQDEQQGQGGDRRRFSLHTDENNLVDAPIISRHAKLDLARKTAELWTCPYLFDEVNSDKVRVIVERIVADTDEIIREIRFVGWQATHAGERQVKKALRSTPMKHQLHHDNDPFDLAYGYIQQYYAMQRELIN